MRKQLILFSIGLFVVLAISAQSIKQAWASPDWRPVQQATPAQQPGFLTGPNSGDPADIALAYLHQQASLLGLTPADLADIVVTDRYVTRHNGVTHLYYRQRYQGIEVDNGDININIAADGAVISLGNRFVADLARQVNATAPVYTAASAVAQAAAYLHLPASPSLQVIETSGGPAQAVTFSADGLAKEPIPAKLVYFRQPEAGVRLAWHALIHPPDHAHLWKVGVDAVTGELIHKEDLILHEGGRRESAAVQAPAELPVVREGKSAQENASDEEQPPSPLDPPSYRVFALPQEHPNDGPGLPDSQRLVDDPADLVASPFGWHDIDALPGHDFLDTRGNNVFAQEDRDGNDLEGFRPTGRQPRRFNFDYRFNPELEPVDAPNLSVAIVNLFYLVNTLHDITYQYGFDEASGNFQVNNYDRGGLGGDALHADTLDAYDWGARNNAFFMPTPDGIPPAMGMFVFDLTTPNRDSALDNGIIAHEYAHGVSNRLVGGPANPYCLGNAEQMGEGWSDWFMLTFTAKADDAGARPRGIGTYSIGQPADGPGFRQYFYSTDRAINPLTYAAVQQSSDIYHIGQVWATMLWDLHWALVEQYGFDANFSTGSGGNNIALRLVMDGMKFAPCEPGLVDARDAILIADQVNSGGANQCLIWQSFARRGLGFSANQGSPFTTFDGREAFDLPPVCRDDLSLTKLGSPEQVEPGGVLSFTLAADNYTAQALTGLTLTDPIPANTTYLPGSASDGGSEAGGVITWQLPDLNPDEAAVRTFAVTVNPDIPGGLEILSDTMEIAPENWIPSGLWHWKDDSEPCGRSASPTHSWYYGDDLFCTYPDNSTGRLTTATPITLPQGKATLTFQSWEDVELCCDQRTVLVSTDGVDFTTVWLSGNDNVASWYEASVDLSAYSGQSIWLSFEFISDSSVTYAGWYVDDVRITSTPTVNNEATLISNEGMSAVASSTNEVVRLPHIAVAPTAFEETLNVGERVERTLTMSNTGSAPLTFAIVVRGVVVDTATVQVASATSVQVAASQPVPPGTRSYTAGRDQARAAFLYQPKAGALRSAEAPNVLLLAAADVFTLQSILTSFGDLGLVDIFDARLATPTLEQLSTYDSVVVISSFPFADPVAVGDRLAEYVDAGGSVVQTVPTFFDPLQSGWGLRGRWLDEGYSPLIGTGDWFLFANLGEFDALHPIMAGVTQAGDSLRQVMELAPGAELVASWTDDEFVATKDGIVALNTYLADDFSWTGDVGLIVHNSIVWLQEGDAPPANWLTVVPESGEVPPAGSQAVQVMIDAGAPGIVSGDYAALLRIRSNAPEAPVVEVPVRLHAVGPELSLGDQGGWFGRPVTVPVSFTGNGFQIAAASFSLDMDEGCLSFDPTDRDGDGVPDAISFSLPPGFQGVASADGTDSDGEVDFFIADLQPPLEALPDGILASVAFRPTCLPSEGPLTVGVNFSTAPTATVSDLSGVTVPLGLTAGLITVEPGLPGDCNQDGAVDAGDTISCVLEIFDGDGSFWQDAPGGSFAGSPQGCDSNQDNQIDAADVICTVLIIFQGQGACQQGVVVAGATATVAASLTLADGVNVAAGAATMVPIQLNTNGNAVVAAAFTVVFDPALLHFDPSDANGDGLPDALHFNVPGDFVKNVNLEASGRLQILLADLALPLTSLPDGVLATINLTADGAAAGQTATVAFAADTSPSLGADTGSSISLVVEDGSVVIGGSPSESSQNRIYLPNVSK